jgi:hypothetical protein
VTPQRCLAQTEGHILNQMMLKYEAYLFVQNNDLNIY